MMMDEEARKRDILRRCMREAGYSVRPETAMTEGGTPVTEARVLTFDFIEDDRFGGSKRALIEKDMRLKKLVNVVREGSIRTLHFSGVDGPSLQWRKTYWVARSGTETWEDVMGKINSIQAPPYKFERIGLPKGLAGELGGVGLPQMRISDPIQWDNSEWVVTEHGAIYPWQYGHLGNVPIYVWRNGRWVSYFDQQKIVSLPDVFEQEYLKTKRGLPTETILGGQTAGELEGKMTNGTDVYPRPKKKGDWIFDYVWETRGDARKAADYLTEHSIHNKTYVPVKKQDGWGVEWGVSREEREELLERVRFISDALEAGSWRVMFEEYTLLRQKISDLQLERRLSPRRHEKITMALNRLINAYHGHYKAPYRPDKEEMAEAIAVVEKQVRGLS